MNIYPDHISLLIYPKMPPLDDMVLLGLNSAQCNSAQIFCTKMWSHMYMTHSNSFPIIFLLIFGHYNSYIDIALLMSTTAVATVSRLKKLHHHSIPSFVAFSSKLTHLMQHSKSGVQNNYVCPIMC